MIEALIVAIIVIAVVWVIAHLVVRILFMAGPLPSEFAWVVYIIALLITIVVLWRVIAPAIGPLP